MRWISNVMDPFQLRQRSHKRLAGCGGRAATLSRDTFERLESRLALAVAPSNFPIAVVQNGSELTITYSQSDPATGFAKTSDQHVVIDIDEYFAGIGAPTQRVNVYASTNPAANFGAPVGANKVFLGITAIHVTVPNYDDPGVNNNSLTIKGINGPTDRIIVSGSGRTAAGRWSDEAAPQLQTVFDIAGIDDLTVTAGGTINVSGAFTNDTGDASIHAVGEIAERQTDQTTATIIVGETTPAPGSLPQSRLVSNYIEMIGAELDIYSDIEATGQVILRQPATTPQTSRANLILPYDVMVTDPDGVLELHSTRNIVQLQSSTLVAHKLVAVSNVGDINTVDATTIGPWLIDLGSVNNDFDTVSLGMVSNAIDTPTKVQSVAARGRIGVRDIDDMTVADFGILATTGIVTLRSVGTLTVDAAVQAAGLTLQSDTSVVTTPRAIISVNSPTPGTGSIEPVVYTDLGVTIDVSTASGDAATGDVTLDGRIVMDLNNVRENETTTNATSYGGMTIHAAGVTTLNSQVLTLGDIRVFSKLGITVAGQLQAGGTFVSKNGTVTELVASDLSLTTATGGITVASPTANLPLPSTLSATNLLAMDAGGDISIAGSLFAGTIYGNTVKLPENNATLPSITIRTTADVDLAQTAVLRTSAYGTNYNASPNPQIGLITVSDANSLTSAATISADGAFTVSTRGDIALSGPATAREKVSLRTQAGNIEVQGALRSTGASYTVNAGASPPFVVPASWTPDVSLDAPNGGISTSDLGTLTAGTLVLAGVTSYGTVRLNAQQDIEIGATVNTPGLFTATSTLGMFRLSALLQTNNGNGVTISAGNGIVQSDRDFARIVTSALTLTNTAAAGTASDIDLRAKNNQIGAVTAINFADGGSIRIANNGVISIGGLIAERDGIAPSTISLASTGAISQTGAMQANDLVVSSSSLAPITLTNSLNNVDRFAAKSLGAVSYTDADEFETGLTRGGPLGVEVSADSLSLRSVATGSKIRVVSGLKYRTLSIAAGTNGGANVGTVEYVTTSAADNPPTLPNVPKPFQGSLRDMIKYANDNTATYVINGSRKPQPTAMVFDETGYAVEEITLGAALPAFGKPVTFNGGRLEAAATTDRLGIKGTSKIATGLSFGLGSNESTITNVAAYGFTAGSAIVLGSGNNTVTNVYAGLKADGTTSANLVGLEIAGTTASNNLVGSTVLDSTTANRFGGNTTAGILIRNNASGNRVFGNVIGFYDDPGLGVIGAANGDGIRITGAAGNLIGTPDEVQPDFMPSRSNLIVGNKGNGIQIVTSTGASLANANRVRNNFVSGNKVGVAVSSSKFAVLGGIDGKSSNVIVNQTGAGVAVTGSTNVQIVGNLIGLFDTATAAGNGSDGISITASSQQVEISSGNRISANKGNGVAIGTGSSGVTVTGNTIGGTLDDGTSAGNAIDGVAITSSIGNTVGAANKVSNNGRHGISISDARATALAAGNRIFGSQIFANTANGVLVAGGSASTIGGTTPTNANFIYSNGGDGIKLDRSNLTGAPTGYAIQGNYIGTNTNRDVTALGNAGSGIVISQGVGNVISDGNVAMNNSGSGIELLGGSANVVGSGAAGKGNTITNNAGSGIRIAGISANVPAAGHVIAGNTISANGASGVAVSDANVSGITIGQKVTAAGVAGLGNTISLNTRYAVEVAGKAQQIGIQGNSMFANSLGGIFLAAGANRSAAQTLTLTSAVIRSTTGGGQSLTIAGSLQNALFPNQQYSVEIYANAPADGNYSKANVNLTGYQQRRLLGTATVTADAKGNATFTFTLTTRVAVGEVITATATSLRLEPGSTSNQSSKNVTANLPGIQTPRF